MSQEPLPPWSIEGERPLLTTRIFDVVGVTARSGLRPERCSEFVVVRPPDWVNVIALTQANEVVLIDQYRHGTAALTLEIPGGMVDPGEDLVAAGVRELAEETGYTGDSAELIGCVTPNPAFQSNRCGTVLVRGARLTQGQDLDTNEEIRVLTAPLSAIDDAIREGRIHHALVICAFHHLALQ